MSDRQTISFCRSRLADAFRQAGIDSAELDARLLIEAATGLDHQAMILHAERELAQSELATIEEMMRRRLAREPVAKIIGQKEFYGRSFIVNRHVLDPRPDTETVVEQVLEYASANGDGGPVSILDIGTGSGAIIITLLCELESATGVGVDISAKALQVAGKNAQRHNVSDRLDLVETSYCRGIDHRFDIVVSNPPYIETAVIEGLDDDVRKFDPMIALDGGRDGLDAYRQIASCGPQVVRTGGLVVLEVGQNQAEQVQKLFFANGFTVSGDLSSFKADLSGINRVVSLLWPK